ncbi:hypothetical protein LJ707_16680 [Mucilaginibacter sp. UR6-1]|uniref:hypothetical protein n=1 Tax=Mucilaginibacter sp. UR6-1 TaxID=1435643 RepID=UPI001E3BF963|nr:hypothetical protein [Mucilaginibacter sp. UR6-1]MCC8410581.1 hypothetical protein [Mucilaginibacter sp. UR6-1]
MPSEGASDFVFVYLMGALAGLLWSIPSFLVLLVCTAILSHYKIRSVVAKSWLTIAGIALTCLPFYIIEPNKPIVEDELFSSIILIYAAVISASIWLFRFTISGSLYIQTVPECDL